MSILRKATKQDAILVQADIEAPRGKDAPYTGPAPASRGARLHPVFLAKAIFRKVFDMVNGPEVEDVRSPGGITTLLKDIVLGILMGFVTISCAIVLDHRNVIHFQSAHSFRENAFLLLNDPETIANVEESAGLKFLSVTEYEIKRKEIDGAAAKLESANEMLEKRDAEAKAKEKEKESLQAEYDRLYGDPLLGLNSFCTTCAWGGRQTCGQRVQYLRDTYSTGTIEAKISAMSHPSCIREG